ncbi:MAG: hypothetical protein AAB903_02905 [Patescibacteria group bacterium]
MIKNFSFLLSIKTWFEPIVFPDSLAVLASQSEATISNFSLATSKNELGDQTPNTLYIL